MTTDREALVEKVALALQLADECEIPDDYSHGLDPNVSDWGAFLADAVIDLIMGEAAKVAGGFHPGSIIGREIAAALRAENERLRAALQRVDDDHGYGLPPDTRSMIRAALEEK